MKLKLKHITKNFVVGENNVMVISTKPERIIYIGTMKELKNSNLRFFKKLRNSKLVAIRSNYKYYENIYENNMEADREFENFTVFQIDTTVEGLSTEYIKCYEQTF